MAKKVTKVVPFPINAERIGSVIKLKDNLEQIFAHNDRIELNDLMPLGLDKISAYLALLFLSIDTDYDLEQDEFYSDLYVVKGGSHATA